MGKKTWPLHWWTQAEVKAFIAMAGLGGLVALFWYWKIYWPGRQFENFTDPENDDDTCTSEGKYAHAYVSSFGPQGGCKELSAILNTIILAATLVLLYWMIQHAKHDVALCKHGLGIRKTSVTIVIYVLLMAAVVVNTWWVIPTVGISYAIGLYIVLVLAWVRFKDEGRYTTSMNELRALSLNEKIENYNSNIALKIADDTKKRIREALFLRHELLTATPGRQPMWATRNNIIHAITKQNIKIYFQNDGFWSVAGNACIRKWLEWKQRLKFVWVTKFFGIRQPSSINPRLFLGFVLLLLGMAVAYQKTLVMKGIGALVVIAGCVLLASTLLYRHKLEQSRTNLVVNCKSDDLQTYSNYMKAQMRGDRKAPSPDPHAKLPSMSQLDALVNEDGLIGEDCNDKLTTLKLDSEQIKSAFITAKEPAQRALSLPFEPEAQDAAATAAQALPRWTWRWEVSNLIKTGDNSSNSNIVKNNYSEVSWEWWNGAWVNFWRLFLVSSIFHLVAIYLTTTGPDGKSIASRQVDKYCNDVTGVPDECAFYTMLERYNLLGSLILTLILFSIFIIGGKQKDQYGIGKLCREIIGTEDVKANGEWWQVMSDNSVRRALVLYFGMFAVIGHGGAVFFVFTNQKTSLRNSAVHQSYVDNPKLTGVPLLEKDKDTITEKEQRNSIVQYAMENDLASNAIMILLLSFLVPYVSKNIWQAEEG